MLHLKAEIDAIRRGNGGTAQLGCALLDAVRRHGMQPAEYLRSQRWLRLNLLQVEAQLEQVQGRAKELGRRLGERAKRVPAFGRAVGEHLGALRAREHVLALRRVMLRQLGDALAWVALGEDARVILPLYRDHCHRLPHREGLSGPAEMARRAMESGEFLVAENDLTRCLGVADITVVYAARPWKVPLTYEVKSSAQPEWRVGAQLNVVASGVVSDDPGEIEMHERFKVATGFPDLAVDVRSRENPAQTAAQLSAAELLRKVSRMRGRPLPGPSRRTWSTIDTVLSRALADGANHDIAERGIVFLASRAVDDYVPEAVLNDLFEKACGLPGFEAAESATSVDLRRHEDWSAVALPIALWPVGRRVRGALLSGELFLACVMRPNVWHDAMRAEGLELVEEGRAWKVQGPTFTGRLDPLEVGKLRLGVAFSGVSPREIAAGLAASLKTQPS